MEAENNETKKEYVINACLKWFTFFESQLYISPFPQVRLPKYIFIGDLILHKT